MARRNKIKSAGGAMLVTAMAALCMASMSMLAMASAREASRLSLKCAEPAMAYHAAKFEADRDVAAARAARDGTLDKTYKISDSLELHVTAVIEDGTADVIYKAMPAGGWAPDDGMELIGQ